MGLTRDDLKSTYETDLYLEGAVIDACLHLLRKRLGAAEAIFARAGTHSELF